jgi:hypothetical protein
MGVLLQLKPPHRAVLAIALVGAVVASLAWLCARDPQITFLSGDGRAEWIMPPSAPDGGLHFFADLDAVFRREFTLEGQPQTARLSVRAAKRVQLKINGRVVDAKPGGNWKVVSSFDVMAYLHTGTNTIEARVFNDNAPPALWLVLETDRLTLQGDSTWDVSFVGSAWCRAALATMPRMPGRGNLMAGGGGTLGALSVVWPAWIFFGGLSMAVWLAGRWWFNRTRKPNATVTRRQGRLNNRTRTPKAGAADWLFGRETIVPLMIMAALWVALFCNNTRLIPHVVGFDKHGHADYNDYIQKHWTPPLPNQGWEMFQPPLYYGISAVTLSAFGLSVTDVAGAMTLRWLTMFFGKIGRAHV